MANVEQGALIDEARRTNRQMAMVVDLNKCIGCQTCTMACKNLWTSRPGTEQMRWMNVTTYPGEGYPHNWQKLGGGFHERVPMPGTRTTMEDVGSIWSFNGNEVFFRENGKNPESRYKPFDTWYNREPTSGYNWDEDQGGGAWPNPYFFYLPRLCNHCTHPACLEACPRKAISKREEDGIVLINQESCRGYRFCLEACPYKAIYYNFISGTSEKCIFCYPRLESGTANACVRQCPGRTRHIGFLDDKNGHVHKLVKKWQVALPLRPDFETKPNVYYIPPWSAMAYEEGELTEKKRIPMSVLEGLFGPKVQKVMATLDTERKKTAKGEQSELMDLLISRNWHDMLGGFSKIPTSFPIPVVVKKKNDV